MPDQQSYGTGGLTPEQDGAAHHSKEMALLACATLATTAVLLSVPSWQHALSDICHVAGLFALATMLTLWVTRTLGHAGVAFERNLSACFLAGMPVVYIIACLQAGGVTQARSSIGMEIAALPLYAGLAVFGYRYSPWFLVGGIAAHGVAWDAWHYFIAGSCVPRWYALGCLVVDVALSAYLAKRVSVWRKSRAWAARQHVQRQESRVAEASE